MPKIISGTNEWSDGQANCCTGCAHNCLYCYARWTAVTRKGAVAEDAWENEVPGTVKVVLNKGFTNERVMFPTKHDITPNNLEACLQALREMLVTQKLRVLIVSKPHMECIAKICAEFVDCKEQILFRFTIGSHDDQVLRAWEPGAPCFAERLACLELAHQQGFETSVSCEPMLDPPQIEHLVSLLMPHVTDSIWIGKMNDMASRINLRTTSEVAMMATLHTQQQDKPIRAIYERLKSNPKIKWKESIKKVVGLDLATASGQDA